MDESKFEKSLKDVKWFSVIILVLLIVMSYFQYNNLNTLLIIIRILESAILLGTIFGCNSRKIYGPICGIITSCLMILSILSLDVIDMILGICLLVECIQLVKYMKKH